MPQLALPQHYWKFAVEGQQGHIRQVVGSAGGILVEEHSSAEEGNPVVVDNRVVADSPVVVDILVENHHRVEVLSVKRKDVKT